jgi:hypothetical protein
LYRPALGEGGIAAPPLSQRGAAWCVPVTKLSGSSPTPLWGLVDGFRDEPSAAETGKRIHFGNVSTMKQGAQLFGLFLRHTDPNWIPFWFFLSCGHRQHPDRAPFYTQRSFSL